MSRNPHFYLRKKRNGARRSGSCAYCHKDGHYARDKKRQITCPALRSSEERKKKRAGVGERKHSVASRILAVQPQKALSTAKLTEALDNGTLVSECTFSYLEGSANRARPPPIVTKFSGLDFSSSDDSPSPTNRLAVEAQITELQEELAQAVAKNSKSWADASDINDLEEQIEELEAQLS